MAFAKKLFFTTLFISILMETTSASADPWAGFAWYFQADIKSWLPATNIAFTPIELATVLVLGIWALRGRRDRRFRFERGLLFWPVIGLLGMLAYGLLWGVVQSGDLTVGLWEIRALALAVAAYFLVGTLFTHRRDLDTLMWVLIISIGLLGIECLIRFFFFIPGHQVGDLDYDHEDAGLLGFAILLSVAIILLGEGKRLKWFALASIVIDTLALAVTHRRVGFAGVAAGLVFLALILYRTNRSLFLKIVPVTALVVAGYLGAEWNCTYGTVCQPARAISSQFNPNQRDANSDQYRIMERIDLIYNIQASPVTGRGFGNTFVFYVPLPDLSFWSFWQYTSHNAILWVWVKAGMFGFMAFWWLVASGLYQCGRLIRSLTTAGDKNARTLLGAAACLIAVRVIVSYVDLGLTSDRSMLLFGVMFGIIGHLPMILRRSTNTDTGNLANSLTNTNLDKEAPEVQVGVLAHVLVTSAEEGIEEENTTSTRRTPFYPRSSRRRTGKAAWGDEEPFNGRASWGREKPFNGRASWGDQELFGDNEPLDDDERVGSQAGVASSLADDQPARRRTAARLSPEEIAPEEFPWSR